jgi:hypothetical protein
VVRKKPKRLKEDTEGLKGDTGKVKTEGLKGDTDRFEGI